MNDGQILGQDVLEGIKAVISRARFVLDDVRRYNESGLDTSELRPLLLIMAKELNILNAMLREALKNLNLPDEKEFPTTIKQ